MKVERQNVQYQTSKIIFGVKKINKIEAQSDFFCPK